MNNPNRTIFSRLTITVSICIFVVSLTQDCFVTMNSGSSFLCFIFGFFGLIFGGANLTWLANPLLFASWVTINRYPKVAIYLSLMAFLGSLSFLLFDSIVDNEGGVSVHINGYKLGYWLWVLSSFTMIVGSFIQNYINERANKQEQYTSEK